MLESGRVLFRLRAFDGPFGQARLRQSLAAFPHHERGNAEINHDGNNANDQIDVAGPFQHLNQLRADFRPADRADRHDQSEF